MSFTYNDMVPNPPDNPSADVGDMQQNTKTIANAIAVDHFGFNNINCGKHNQVTMPSRGAAPATVAGSGDLYVNTDSAGQQALWFVRDGFPLSNVQLTTSKILAPTVASNGVTFLPGGLLFQWGSSPIAANPAATVITFTQPFTNAASVYSITVSRITADTGTTAQEIRIVAGSVAANQFSVVSSSSSAANVIYWMAIGS